MKKTKAILILILALIIIGGLTNNIKAHTVELDPKSYINFPSTVYNGEGNIYISSLAPTGYSLYYQAVEMSKTAYNNFTKIKTDGEAVLDPIKNEINQMDIEVKNLEKVYKDAKDVYKAKIDGGATEEEAATEKEAYTIATTNYNNKVKEYNDKVKQYNDKAKEIQADMYEVVPMYVESNWIKTEKEFSYDTSAFSDEKVIVMWAKLDTTEGTYYDQVIYIMQGTKKEVESVKLDMTSLELNVGITMLLTATVEPANADNKTLIWSSDNPSVATVVDGKVTGVSAGTANITVKAVDGNASATCKVTVTSGEETVDPTPEQKPEQEPTPDNNAGRTDFSNAKFEFKQNGGTCNMFQNLKISNVNLVEDSEYYIYMSHNKDENVVVTDINSLYDGKWTRFTKETIEEIYLNGEMHEIIETSGDIYVWVCEVDSNITPKMVVNAKKIDRIKQMPLGTRLTAYFFNDETATFCWEVNQNENRKVNIKIGTITDKSILKAIKNGEADCLQKLLNYSKSADSIYTGTVKLGEDKTITDSINLVDKAYYYVYMELEDENGKYHPVEDVSLYQALVNEKVGKNLFNYLDDNFVWDLEEDKTPSTPEQKPETKPEKDNTTASGKIPQTGVEIITICSIALITLIGTIGYIKYKKLADL